MSEQVNREASFEVSDSLLFRFWSYVDVKNDDECWPWQGSKMVRGGYGQINEKGKLIKAHRLSLLLQNGSLDPKCHVCHRCNNPVCVNPHHLYEGDSLSNTHDKIAVNSQFRFLIYRGELNYQTGLKDDDIRIIRTSKDSGSSLARKYNVTRQCIWRIRHRKSWKHID